MSDSTNSLGNVTGGNTPTGNPQNIGSQNLAAPQNNLQSQSSNLFSGSSLRLTDQNGQPLKVSATTKTTVQPVTAKSDIHKNHNLAVFGVCGLIILAVFVATWLMTRRSDLTSH